MTLDGARQFLQKLNCFANDQIVDADVELDIDALTKLVDDRHIIARKGDTLRVDFFTPFTVDMNDPSVRCGNCRFWLPHDLAPTCLGGECHRLSPLCKFEGMNTPAYWPETEPDQKCGEFSPRLIGSVVTGCPSCRTPVPKSSSPIPPPDPANKP